MRRHCCGSQPGKVASLSDCSFLSFLYFLLSSSPSIYHPHVGDSQLRPLFHAPDSCIQQYLDTDSTRMTTGTSDSTTPHQTHHVFLLSLPTASICPIQGMTALSSQMQRPKTEEPSLAPLTHSLCSTAHPSAFPKAPSTQCLKYLYSLPLFPLHCQNPSPSQSMTIIISLWELIR